MEEFRGVCSNPWCKGHFIYTTNDIKIIDDKEVPPRQCKKCISFSTELSGGVIWEDKEYEGDRFDGQPHQIRYRVTNYKL